MQIAESSRCPGSLHCVSHLVGKTCTIFANTRRFVFYHFAISERILLEFCRKGSKYKRTLTTCVIVRGWLDAPHAFHVVALYQYKLSKVMLARFAFRLKWNSKSPIIEFPHSQRHNRRDSLAGLHHSMRCWWRTLIDIDLVEAWRRQNISGEFRWWSCWEIVIIKPIHTFTSNKLFEQRRFGLACPSLALIKAGATQTETSLLKQYVAGECVDLLDDSKERLWNIHWHRQIASRSRRQLSNWRNSAHLFLNSWKKWNLRFSFHVLSSCILLCVYQTSHAEYGLV